MESEKRIRVGRSSLGMRVRGSTDSEPGPEAAPPACPSSPAPAPSPLFLPPGPSSLPVGDGETQARAQQYHSGPCHGLRPRPRQQRHEVWERRKMSPISSPAVTAAPKPRPRSCWVPAYPCGHPHAPGPRRPAPRGRCSCGALGPADTRRPGRWAASPDRCALRQGWGRGLQRGTGRANWPLRPL